MNSSLEVPSYISRQVESSRLFFLESSDKDAFSVPCGGYERCSVDYRIDRPGVPWYCLEFISRGSGKLFLGDHEHELHPGFFYIYGPGLSHRIESSAENPLGKYFVAFQGKEAEGFLKANDLVPGMVARCHKGDFIRSCFDMMIDRGVRKSRLAKPLCALTVRQLLLLCSDEATAPVNEDSPAFATYSRVRDYIAEHFMALNSLDAVAKTCNVEATYLCRLFARFHDESPYQFLTRLRMDQASRLLLDENTSVKSVAEQMGFKDAFHFSRVFKSIHHVPPSKFRILMDAHVDK